MTSIKAEKRAVTGKGLKNLRKAGKIPAVVYGAGENGILLEVSSGEFDRLFRKAGESTLVQLEIGSDKRNVLIHDVAFDPIRDIPVHVDFLQVRMDKLIKAKVELSFEGESQAVKAGGILVKVLHELEIEALPGDLPHVIKVDLCFLKNFEDKFTVGDLALPQGVKTHLDKDDVLALVETPKTEEELNATAAPAEIDSIEVIKKEKKEAGEGEVEVAEVPSKKEE